MSGYAIFGLCLICFVLGAFCHELDEDGTNTLTAIAFISACVIFIVRITLYVNS